MNLWLQEVGWRGCRIGWEFGINMYTLLYLKQITNKDKDLLYSTRNSTQHSVIT